MDETAARLVLGELKRLSDGQDAMRVDLSAVKTNVAVLANQMDEQNKRESYRTGTARYWVSIGVAFATGVGALSLELIHLT